MTDAPAPVNAFDFLAQVKAALRRGENISGRDFCERLCAYPEGLAFVKSHYDEFTQIVLENQETKQQLIKDIVENPETLPRESIPGTASESEITQAKMGLAPSAASTDEEGGVRQNPEFSSLVEKNYKEAMSSADRARKRVQQWIKNDLPEGFKKEEAEKALNDQIQSLQKSKTSRKDARDSLHSWVEKQYADRIDIQQSFDTVIAASPEVVEAIVAPYEKSRVMFQELVEAPGLPTDHYEKVFDYSQSVRSPMPANKTARLETGAAHISQVQSSSKETVVDKIVSTYDTGSESTKASIAVVLNSVMEKEQAAVDGTLSLAAQSSVVERAVEHANRFGQAHGGGFGGLFSTAAASPAATPEVISYAKMVESGGVTTPSLEHFSDVLHFTGHPQQFSFSHTSMSLLEIALEKRLKKSGAGAAAGVVVGSTARETAKNLGTRFLLKLGVGAGSKIMLVGAPVVGWILFAGSMLLPSLGKGVGKATAGISAGGLAPLRAASGAFSDIIHNITGNTYTDPNEKNAWLLALAITVLPFLLAFFFTMSYRQMQRAQFMPVDFSIGGDSPGSIDPDNPGSSTTAPPVSMAPAVYTGPQPTSNLQCLNFNTSSNGYGNPLTAAHATDINSAIDQYKQIGLYNCLLQCPQNKINIYGRPSNGHLYGLAPMPPGQGNLIFYDYLFDTVNTYSAENKAHATARIIAHEFAHELSYFHPETLQAFLHGTTGPVGTIAGPIQRGYCGHRLCTYPSGHYGQCNSSETEDETFAEAAAMYLTGEDLKALCPDSYAFMSQLFGQCAK